MFRTDLKVNDVIELRRFPGGTIELRHNGKELGSVDASPRFATDVWRIFFGKKVADSNLRVMKKHMIRNVAALWEPPPAPTPARPSVR